MYNYIEFDLLSLRHFKMINPNLLSQYPHPISGALHDLVAVAQFKKREKHPWMSVNFKHSSMGVSQVF